MNVFDSSILNAVSLVEVLRCRAQAEARKKAYVFLKNQGQVEDPVTFSELDQRARLIGGYLREVGKPGDRILLFYPADLEYVSAFLGAMYAGMVPVPLYPPRPNQKLLRVAGVIADCGAKLALTTEETLPKIKSFLELDPHFSYLKVSATDFLDPAYVTNWQPPKLIGDSLAFLQYTSGSTGSPKGVMVTHGNLIANERSIAKAFETKPKDICLNWLPLYHDMGLIGAVLHPLYRGFTAYIQPSLDFVRAPISWLEGISRYKATLCGSPNFGYELCVKRLTPETLANLDLSSWRVAFNGAEPVRPDTLERFAQAFKPAGFRASHFFPTYGMAEATLFMTGGKVGRCPEACLFSGEALKSNQVVETTVEDTEKRALMSCGWHDHRHGIRIVNPATLKSCPQDRIGEIWFRGPSKTKGYWQQPELTRSTFQAYISETGEGPFLRTGDLGFVHQGNLFIIGRCKDLIIVRGLNHYPQDLELSSERAHPACVPGGAAAFTTEEEGEERLVIVQEVKPAKISAGKEGELIAIIRGAISEAHELAVHGVVLVKKGAVPKTSSGKIQRFACRNGYLKGSFSTVAVDVLETGSQDGQLDVPKLPARGRQRQEILGRYLKGLTATVLGINTVTLKGSQPLNQMGLNSLQFIQITQRLEQDLGLVLPVVHLMEGKSLDSLAELVGNLKEKPAVSQESAAPMVRFPLSHNQRSMWFLQKLTPGSTAYNVSFALEIAPGFIENRLRNALKKLVMRHQVLRTGYGLESEVPVQFTSDTLPDIQVIKAQKMSQNLLNRTLGEMAEEPFDLTAGTPLRLVLFQRNGKDLLFVNMHHIAVDFWSVLVMMDELFILYTSHDQAHLPVPTSSYRDFVRVQQNYLESEQSARDLSYWERELGSTLPVLDLPIKSTRPRRQSFKGANTSFKLDLEDSKTVKVCARSLGTTPFSILLSVYMVLLHRLSNQNDLVVGVPTAGRPGTQLNEVVGYFVNPISIRGQLTGSQPFSDYARQVRGKVINGLNHATFPFAKLVEHLNRSSHSSRSPIFQAMFVLQIPHRMPKAAPLALRTPGSSVEIHGLELKSYALDQRSAQFDLTLMMVETEDGFAAVWEYAEDLFEATTMHRFSNYFKRLVHILAGNPGVVCGEAILLDEAERQRILHGFNDPACNLAVEELVPQKAARISGEMPGHVAVADCEGTLTYQELHGLADKLAAHMIIHGLGPECIVAVCMPRSMEFVVAALAAFKAGAAYLPLDYGLPQHRLDLMLKDSGAALMITRKHTPLCYETKIGEICLDPGTDGLGLEESETAFLPRVPSSENLAYVIYTSGSTGSPKGVAVRHGALANLVAWHQAAFTITNMDRASMLAGLGFDAAVWELWPYLCAGASLSIPPAELVLQPEALRNWLIQDQISIGFLATPLMERMLSIPWPQQGPRILLTGGDKLNHYPRQGLPFQLYNNYGPTENTVVATSLLIDSESNHAHGPPIGRPIAKTKGYVLAPNGLLCPLGVLGELCLGGQSLASGYVNAPAQTAQVFRPDPFSPFPGQRLYHSGDLVRHNSSGELEFLGRMDHQLQLRGFRIEPGEIEAALCKDKRVAEAVVHIREGDGEKRLLAYVVPVPGAHPSQGDLLQALEMKLPEYMLPAGIVTLDSLPLTPNGKVDRKALPDPEFSTGQPVPPRTHYEEVVASFFSEILGSEVPGIDISFLELGGHSLCGAQMVARINETFNINLALASVFEAGTVRNLTAIIEKTVRGSSGTVDVIVSQKRSDYPPLSRGQRQLWYLDRLTGPSPTYNLPVAYEIHGNLNVSALECSVYRMIEVHEALRTAFPTRNGEPYQSVGASGFPALALIDLSGLDEGQWKTKRQAIERREALQPFDLEIGPCLRVTLVRRNSTEHGLMISLHHMVADGWSVGLLLRDLSLCYGAFCRQEEPLPPKPSITYIDYAIWQEKWLTTHSNRLASFWHDYLQDALPLLQLPMARPRPATQSYSGATLDFEINETTNLSLQALARENRTSRFTVMLAAFKMLLRRYSGNDDLVVGTPVANRSQRVLESVVGYFVNTLPIRTVIDGSCGFTELLSQITRSSLETFNHGELPFEKMVEMLNPDRQPGCSPIFQVMFSMIDEGNLTPDLSGLKVHALKGERATAKQDLTLICEPSGVGLLLSLEYNTDLFHEVDMEQMGVHLVNLLTSIAQDSSRPVNDYHFLDEGEQNYLLETLCRGEQAPASPSVPDLWKAAVAQFYELEAVSDPATGKSLTYGRLAGLANGFAHQLRAVGIGRERLVGIHLPRSAELVAAMMGCFTAGAAYVPFSWDDPTDRLASMAADSGIAALITSNDKIGISVPTIAINLAEEFAESPDLEIEPQAAAYVIYTSGSTGRPKGVVVPHSSLANLVSTVAGTYKITKNDRVLQFASASFDVFCEELYPTLVRGACLVITPEPIKADVTLLNDFVDQNQVSLLNLPSEYWQEWVLLLRRTKACPRSLRLVIAGSSKVMGSRLALWRQLLGNQIDWFTAYGPTECTVTTILGQGAGSPGSGVVPIGRPLANTTVYVLDRQGKLLPVGCPGQLCIGGASVARGYLHRPSLTAAVFLPDPFALSPGQRLYHTGDLARLNSRGELCFLGRIDQQVKLRGYRIEPGEVDALLLNQPKVLAALTLAREDIQQLVSYVVTELGQDLSHLLKGILKKHLPNYMVPAAIVCMERFPFLPSDKVDIGSLPKQGKHGRTAVSQPTTPTQQLLAGLMAAVLKVPVVGLDDHFFDLGGHSLSATRLITEISDAFQVSLPVSAIFEAPKLVDLAEKVVAAMDAREGLALPPILARQPGASLSLSFAQGRLWFLDQLEGPSSSYNVHGTLILKGPLEISALEMAMERVLARHEIMRTRFPSVGGEPGQVISEKSDFSLTLIETNEANSKTLSQLAADLPFNLAQGPLFRTYLLRLEPTRHILLATMHHIISDGWSVALFIEEITAFYRRALTGKGSKPAALKVQYADYAAWQREVMHGEFLREQVTFWKRHLKGAAPLLEIPLDFRRPKIQTTHGALFRFELSEGTTAKLEAMCERTGVTAFMLVLAAYQMLLARYSGAQKVVVGTPIANRERKEVEALLGFFVNTIPLNLDLSGNPCFLDILARVRKTHPLTYAHGDIPFEKLVEELRPPRSESYSPIFQAFFVMEDNALDQMNLTAVDVQFIEQETVHALFDVTLGLQRAARGFQAYWKYNINLFEPKTMERMSNHLLNLIEDALERPRIPLNRLMLSSDEERRTILVDFNRIHHHDPVRFRAVDWLSDWAEKTPNALALASIDGVEHIDYETLARRVDTLAERLCRLGVGPEDFVGLCLPRNTEMLTALLAIHRSGAALLPLDPEYPQERLAFIIADSAMTALVTNERLIGALPAANVPVLILDGTYSEGSGHFQAPPVEPLAAAYLIYTSGSTGQPKGVVVSHHALSSYVRACRELYELASSDRVLQFTSINFDVAIHEIFGPISVGAVVVPRDQEMMVSPQSFMETIEKRGFTKLSLPTAYFHELARAVCADQCKIPRCLHFITFAGERAKPELVAGWLDRIGTRVKLINGYGPTEATVVSLAATLEHKRDLAYREIPIGKPLIGESATLLNAEMELIPAGIMGELFIGGNCIARGYHRRPALTAQRFLPDPYTKTPGGRVYQTGDRVRLRSDHQVEYLGRTDRQVKLHGFRVELGEIEAALTNHEEVDEAIVVLTQTRLGEPQLVAYLLTRSESKNNDPNWRSHLRKLLPEYMVPAAFIPLKSIPLNPNGKIDYAAFPEPKWDGNRRRAIASTPTEIQIAQFYVNLLDLPQVDIFESFFDLGGHSLLAARLIARIREHFAINLPMRSLFNEPTVSGLSRLVDDARGSDSPPLMPSVAPEPRPEPIPTSFAQTRLWFLDHLEGTGGLYNVPTSLSLRGVLDTQSLERSLIQVVHRHESLRTRILSEGGTANQVIDHQANTALKICDLSGLPGERRKLIADRLTYAEVNAPFHLAVGPLLRTHLLRLSVTHFRLLLIMHHIITDGWSMAVFVRELIEGYVARVTESQKKPDPIPLQYADYSLWQRRWLQGELKEKQNQYWVNKLAGIPELLELPTDRPRPAKQGFRGNTLRFSLPKQQVSKLETIAKEQDATLFMGLLALVDLFLYNYSQQQDIVVGTPVANRSQTEHEGIIGLFVNTLALRVSLAENPTFIELLHRVQTTALQAYSHQQVPFEQLLDNLNVRRDLSHAPIFQVMLVLQNLPATPAHVPGLRFKENDLEIGSSKFDLTITFKNEGSALQGWLEYSQDLFDRETVVAMIDHLITLLDSVVAQPQQVIGRLDMITQRERRLICETWNQTTRCFPDNHTLHGLFEDQVARTPQGAALCFDDGQEVWLPYTEMNRRADALAHRLRTMGVGTDTLVGLCMQRSLEMVISMYAILKAGGAYVPIDPDYPQDRIKFMLQDANVFLLLVQPHLKQRFGLFGGTLLTVASGATCKDSKPGLKLATSPHQLAYMIFTSGSSGRPKGAMIAHQAICNRLHWMQREFRLNSDDVVMQKTPFSFDVSLWELFWPLLTGARLIIARPGGHLDPEYLLDLISRFGVTTLHFVPSMLQAFLASKPSDSGHLRRIFCSGEALSEALVQQAKSRFNAFFHNLYGPTEAAVDVTWWSCAEASQNDSVPIGRPIDNTTIYMVDRHGNLVPPRVSGELLIGGVNLGRGYLNRPALTAEKFIPDPFGNQGQRLYRSGDLAHFNSRGMIHFLGRIDHQVKIRGLRLELGEIETNLRDCGGVTDAVVLAKDLGHGLRLVAYLTGWAEEPTLQAALKKRLPEYMLPNYLIFLDAFPLLPNGKINRSVLMAREVQKRNSNPYQPPQTPTERALARVWTDLLNREHISTNHGFFQLGGDSILSIQLTSQLRETGYALRVEDIFNHQTLGDLANFLDQGASKSNPPPVETQPFQLIGNTDREALDHRIVDAYPLSHLQAGMLYHSSLQPDRAIYHDVFSFYLRCPFDGDSMERAVAALMARHPVLRTSFEMAGFAQPLQLVWSHTTPSIHVEDIRTLGEAAQQDVIEQKIRQLQTSVLDWGKPPLISFHLIRRDSQHFQFLIDLHHAILDGWSISLLLTDLMRDYLALVQTGSFADLTKVRTTYRDFIAAEIQVLASKEAKAFWNRTLGDVDFLPFPTRNPSVLDQPERDIRVMHLKLPKNQVHRLQEVVEADGIGLKTLLFCVHLKAISAIYGSMQVTTGMVSHGRLEVPDGERVLGLFLNSLPFSIGLEPGSWRQLAAAVQAKEQELLQWRRFPMGELVRRMGNPLFDALFNFTSYQMFRMFEGQEDFEVLDSQGFEFTNFSLYMLFNLNGADDLILNLSYDLNLVSHKQAFLLRDAYLYALTAMTTDPNASHLDCPLMTDSAYSQLMTLSRPTDREVFFGQNDDPRCIHQLFEARVKLHGAATAILARAGGLAEGNWQALTYAALNQRANQIASYLHQRNVGPETIVGVFCNRHTDLVAGLLGILKAGCAYLPLDPHFPSERLVYMIEDAEVDLILVDRELGAALPQTRANLLFMGDLQDCGPMGFAKTVDKTHRAYVIYTSGSTGKPKGVEITHQSVVNFLGAMKQAPGLVANDIFVGVTTISFDIAALEIYLPLMVGACLVLADRETAADPARLSQLLGQQRATAMQATPATWRMLRAAGWQQPQRFKVLCGGEALPADLASDLLGNGHCLWNLYGPTETTIWSSTMAITPATTSDQGCPMPIGRPITATALYVLDEVQYPALPGVSGELFIGGEGLARCYFQRPSLTAERFLPNPFGQEGSRMYRTGDLVRQRDDGTFIYIRRLDHQVKLRGFRIELGEIEAAILGLQEIEQAVVMIREDRPNDQRLVAYLIPKPAMGLPHSQQITAALRRELPDYMVPTHFVEMDAFPMTTNGKVDRKEMPTVMPTEDNPGETGSAPQSPTEALVASLFGKSLGFPVKDRNSDFFQLGGHSLLATQLVARLQNTFRIHVTLRTLYASPTVGELSVFVEKAQKEGRGFFDSPIEPLDHKGPRPLSFAQQRLWFQYELDNHATVYNIPNPTRISGSLNVIALIDSLSHIIARHESLRTVFVKQGEEPVQEVVTAAPLAVNYVDLSRLGSKEQQTTLAQLQQQENRLPFDLGVAPLIRATLLGFSPHEHVLLNTIHHIAADGWSLGILREELTAAYQAFSHDQPLHLPPLPIQYSDFSQWQRKYMRGDVLQRHVDYWRNQLTGAPMELLLKTDKPRPQQPRYQGTQHLFMLPEDVTTGVRELSLQQEVTFFVTFMASYGVLLSYFSDQSVVLVSTDVANRNRTETEDLIGFFVNQLIFRIEIKVDMSFRDILKQTSEVALDAYTYQDLPFEKIVEALNPPRANMAPFAQAKLVLQNARPGTIDVSGLSLKPIVGNRGGAQLDLLLTLVENGPTFYGHMEYDIDLFNATTIVRWTNLYEQLLRWVIEEPAIPCHQLMKRLGREEKSLKKERAARFRAKKREFRGRTAKNVSI